MTNTELPAIIHILVKGSIENLVKNIFDGAKRTYLVQDFKTRERIILYIINKLRKLLPQNNQFVFEAKYSMGFRNRRIDIAIWDKKNLLLCKLIENSSKLDRGTIYLDSIISHIKGSLNKKNVVGCIISKEVLNMDTANHIKKILKNEFIFCNLNNIFELTKLDSLFEINLK